MSAAMTASEVHKQYTEITAAFRKLIPDPALRLAFSRQVDGYVRQYALGVWQADSASSFFEDLRRYDRMKGTSLARGSPTS